jgi:hypothetical protein
MILVHIKHVRTIHPVEVFNIAPLLFSTHSVPESPENALSHMQFANFTGHNILPVKYNISSINRTNTYLYYTARFFKCFIRTVESEQQ